MYNHQKSKTKIEKINDALIKLNELCSHIGSKIELIISRDYYLFYCINSQEMSDLLNILNDENFIKIESLYQGLKIIVITNTGYEKLEALKDSGNISNQCFVAMWFSDEMADAYKIIKNAIEFIEDGQRTKYGAFRIDHKEHNDNINNQIIAEIRKSKFMVCDLTGYRGGVYFEAGFAYGLGLQVIYTCRKDWAKEQKLHDKNGVIETLLDENDKEISVKKEGVHFDLAHTMRIEWEEDKLAEFEEALKQQIRATIV